MVPVCLWPCLQACERMGATLSTATAHALAFWAADCASGVAFLPKFTPLLYRSLSCRQGCLHVLSC